MASAADEERANQVSQSTVEKTFRVHFVVARDEGGYSALCPEFNVASCGDTEQEAARNLAGAIGEYLAYLMEQARIEEAQRPASPELLAKFFGLEGEALTPDSVGRALEAVVVGSAEVTVSARVDYRAATGDVLFEPPRYGPRSTLPEWKTEVSSYPAEVRVFGATR